MRFLLHVCLLLTGCAGNADPRVVFGKTVFIGDSITAFWDLKASFPADDFINMGISGQTTTDIRARFDRDVIAFNPSTVVILAGTNDILHRANDPATAEANLEFMVTDAREHGIFPVVCTIPPVATDITNLGPQYSGDFNPIILQLNQIIAESRVLAVRCDYHKALADPTMNLPLPGVLKDGVHPSPAGYALMTAVIDTLKK